MSEKTPTPFSVLLSLSIPMLVGVAAISASGWLVELRAHVGYFASVEQASSHRPEIAFKHRAFATCEDALDAHKQITLDQLMDFARWCRLLDPVPPIGQRRSSSINHSQRALGPHSQANVARAARPHKGPRGPPSASCREKKFLGYLDS